MQYSHRSGDELFMRKQFDAIIYACTKDAKIASIFSPQFGKIIVEDERKLIDKRIRASEGRSCKFSPYCKDGAWYARTITVLPSAPLPIERKREYCVLKGIAVVCGVYENIGWLWSDVLGRILVNKELIKDLKNFTCVQFRAIKCSFEEPSVGYQAESISVKEDTTFQSEILRLKKSVIIEENGIALIDGKSRVTLIDDRRVEDRFMRFAELLPVGSEASLLYYEEHRPSADEFVSLFLTQDRHLVEGLDDGAFSTRRHCARVQQVYHANELIEGNDSPSSLIFRFTDEEHFEQPTVAETSSRGEETNLNETVDNEKSEQGMGKAEIVDEGPDSEDVGNVREEAAMVYEVVISELEVSAEEKHLVSEEETPKTTATAPANEGLSHKSAILIAESQNLTSTDDGNSVAELSRCIENENITDGGLLLNMAENIVEGDDSVAVSLPMRSESSGGENRSRGYAELSDDLDSELFDEDFLKEYKEEMLKNERDAEECCAKGETSYFGESRSECEMHSECSDGGTETMSEAIRIGLYEESLNEYHVRNDESNQEERSDGRRSNSECSREMVMEESINFPHHGKNVVGCRTEREELQDDLIDGRQSCLGRFTENEGNVAAELSEAAENNNGSEGLDAGDDESCTKSCVEENLYLERPVEKNEVNGSTESSMYEECIEEFHTDDQRSNENETWNEEQPGLEESEDKEAKEIEELVESVEIEDVEELSSESRDLHEMDHCNEEQLDADSPTETEGTIAEKPQKTEDESMNKEENEDAEVSSEWMKAKKRLDEQIVEVDRMLLGLLDAYKGDEKGPIAEAPSTASSTFRTHPNSSPSVTLGDSNSSVTNRREQLPSSITATEDALKTALREFLTELIICADMAYHIVSAQRGSYLLAVTSDYLCGLLVSLDDLSEFMDITRESIFHSNYHRKYSEYDSHTKLGIAICELMCRYVPEFTKKAIANCVSLSTDSPYSRILLQYLRP
uniref:Tudor domain-containing protein n=2 Tax=Parascaris univalens TaxID=6257 RepID=A0A915C5T3_PARUN